MKAAGDKSRKTAPEGEKRKRSGFNPSPTTPVAQDSESISSQNENFGGNINLDV